MGSPHQRRALGVGFAPDPMGSYHEIVANPQPWSAWRVDPLEPIATTSADVEPSGRVPLGGLRLLVAAAWTLTICVLCWMPRSVMRHVEEDSSWFRLPNLDKVAHFVLFFVFAILWVRAVRWPRKILAIGILGLVLTIVTELGQELPIVGRDATLGDGLTDLSGLLIGLAIAGLIEPVLRSAERRVFGKRATQG